MDSLFASQAALTQYGGELLRQNWHMHRKLLQTDQAVSCKVMGVGCSTFVLVFFA